MVILQNLLGLVVTIALCWLLSWNRKEVKWLNVVKALVAEFVIAFIIVKIPAGAAALKFLSDAITKVLNCGADGLDFVFGSLWNGAAGYIFIVQSLGGIIFVSSLVSVLYYLGVIGFVVKYIGKAVGALMGSTEVESFVAVANMFLGHTDSPILVAKYLPDLTDSEIFVILVSGMGSMSASILIGYTSLGIDMAHLLIASAMVPIGSILVSKIICPQVDKPKAIGGVSMDNKGNNGNVIDALSEGANTGMSMVIAIGASLVGFVGMVAVIDLFLAQLGRVGLSGISLASIFGYVFAPFSWLLGMGNEAITVVADGKTIFEGSKLMFEGTLLGNKLILNEFIAFGDLGSAIKMGNVLSEMEQVILTISLAGFANLSSMGMCVGGIGVLCPEKRPTISRLVLKATIAGVFVSINSALIVSVIYHLPF